MSAFTEKNAARRAHRGAANSKERRQWLNARSRRRKLLHGAFGLLRHKEDTREQYREFAFGTSAEEER